MGLLACIALSAMLLAPAIHQLEHGFEARRINLEIARQTEHVHTDYASFSRALEGASHQTLVCVVCNTVLQTVCPQDSGVEYRLECATVAVISAGVHGADPASDYPIRAPPALG